MFNTEGVILILDPLVHIAIEPEKWPTLFWHIYMGTPIRDWIQGLRWQFPTTVKQAARPEKKENL